MREQRRNSADRFSAAAHGSVHCVSRCRALQADVWSWGILLFELASWSDGPGSGAFQGLDIQKVRPNWA